MKEASLAVMLIGCLISVNICCNFVNASSDMSIYGDKSNLNKSMSLNEKKINPSKINHLPILSDGIVSPNNITQRTPFLYFKVHYYDEDGDPPKQGSCTNYVLVKKLDPGTPYTGIYDMIVKKPFSHDTDMFIYHRICGAYEVGNYSVRFCIMWDETTTPCSYVYYPPLEDDPLTFKVIKTNDASAPPVSGYDVYGFVQRGCLAHRGVSPVVLK
jgi:hypothetical protein